MRRTWLAILLLAGLIGASCQQEIPPTPTVIATFGPPPLEVSSVSPVRLVRNPRVFEDQLVLLAGRYVPQPLLVCRGERHLSPATWQLVADGVEIPASGSDGALRELGDKDLLLEVVGRWRRWTGQIGCGRVAPIRDLWYLEVREILSPNPILAARSLEEDAGEEVDGTGDEAPDSTPSSLTTPTAEPTEVASPETVTPTPEPELTPSPTGSITATLEASLSPTATTVQSDTSTPTLTVSPSATDEQTPTPETPTATATTAPTPTVTETDLVAGDIAYEEIRKDSLVAGQTHRWNFTGEEDDIAYLVVAAAPSLNVRLEFLSPEGVSIGNSDIGLNGEWEVLEEMDLPVSGEYEIVVSSIAGTAGEYLLLVQTDEALPFIIIRDNIIYGGGGSGTIPEDTDHFWNFVGQEGDIVSIRLEPVGNYDMVLYIIGPEGLELDFVDDAGAEAEEVIVNYQLPSDGYYSIGVGEVQFDEANYILTLDLVS